MENGGKRNFAINPSILVRNWLWKQHLLRYCIFDKYCFLCFFVFHWFWRKTHFCDFAFWLRQSAKIKSFSASEMGPLNYFWCLNQFLFVNISQCFPRKATIIFACNIPPGGSPRPPKKWKNLWVPKKICINIDYPRYTLPNLDLFSCTMQGGHSHKEHPVSYHTILCLTANKWY